MVIKGDNRYSVPIPSLKTGQVHPVILGPFWCEDATVLKKDFYLCYKLEGGGLVKVGHMFGLRVMGFKQEVRCLGSTVRRQLLRDVKVKSGSSKSESYLENKLGSMGIDLERL